MKIKIGPDLSISKQGADGSFIYLGDIFGARTHAPELLPLLTIDAFSEAARNYPELRPAIARYLADNPIAVISPQPATRNPPPATPK